MSTKRIFLPFFLLAFIPFIVTGCAETQLAAHWVKKSIAIDEEDSVDNVQYSGVSSKYGTEGNFKIGRPYQVAGVWYTPKESYSYNETGIASWYGPNFHGKKTANGEVYNQNAMTAAHRTLQIPSLVRVTNLENGRSIVVRINDRGPFAHGRIIDMSKRGAELLGFKNQGTARVRVQILPNESRRLAAAAKAGQPIEVAMSEVQRKAPGQRTLVKKQTQTSLPPAMPPPVQQQALPQPDDRTASVQGHYENGNFMPDAVVKQQPVSDTNLYIQVGSFTVMDNAEAVQDRLNDLATVVITQAYINGREYNRVRLGPLDSVDQADRILETAIDRGFTGSQIIVD